MQFTNVDRELPLKYKPFKKDSLYKTKTVEGILNNTSRYGVELMTPKNLKDNFLTTIGEASKNKHQRPS